MRLFTQRTRPPLIAVLLSLTLCAGSALADHHEGDMLEFTSTSDAAKEHARATLHALANVHNSAAQRHAEQAAQADPSFGLAQILVAFTAPDLDADERNRRMSAAIAQMGEATTGELLLALALREWDQNGRADAAPFFTLLGDMYTADPELAYMAALAAGPGGSSEQTAALEAAAERFPDYGALHNQLAYTYWAQGRREDAVRAVRRYVEAEPDHPNAHDSYAEMMLRRGLLGRSEASYRKAIDTDPDFFQGYVGLATALTLQGRYDDARQALRDGLQKAPSRQDRYNMQRALANVYVMEGDLDGARDVLNDIVEDAGADGPQQPVTLARFQLALLDGVEGDADAVMEQLAQAESSRPPGAGWSDFQHAVSAWAQAWSGAHEPAGESAALVEDEDFRNTLTAMVQIEAGDFDTGCNVLADSGDDGPLVRLYLVKCARELGNANAAHAILADMRRTENVDLYAPLDALVMHLGRDM